MDEEQLIEEVEERQDWPGLQPKQAAFLCALTITGGQIVAAARAAKIARSCHYDWLEKSEAYATAFKRAEKQGVDVLKSEAIRRAKEGVREPVFYMGQKCGHVLRYPDGLMQFLLRGLSPEFRDRQEHTGPDGGPIQNAITVTFVRPANR